MPKNNNISLRGLLLRVLLPLVIGFGVIAWLFADDFSAQTWQELHFDGRAVAGIVAALVFAFGRDFGLAWRFHTIASPDLTWKRSFRVDLMCAFASAITPSAVGGSALAIFYLNKEGVGVGRATTLTLTTLFLDELFFVVFCPIIVLLIPFDDLFGPPETRGAFLKGVELVFWLVYSGIVVWTAILFTGIIIKPELVKRLMERLFSLPILRRWHDSISRTMDHMVETSTWVKQCPRRWWLNVFGATTLSWFSRYLVVNALFWAFVPDASPLLIFARQFVVWVVLMVSPTPGGSGISEWMFTEYYGDLIGAVGIAMVLALLWRLISYYLYLVIGVLLLPGYFRESPKEESGEKGDIE